jgi:AcrR family transcriptional regulator
MTARRSAAPSKDGRHERWRAHRVARREELIAAVLAVVSEHGAGVGMDDISHASGIAKPVFYRYFTDKADLFLEVGRTVAETVVAETTAAIDGADSPRAKLAAGIDAYLASIESRPEVYRFVAQHRDLDDYATIVGRHATVVIGGFMRQAGLDSGAAELWGFGIVGLARAAADRWLEQRTMSRAEVVRYLTDLVWPGLSGSTLGGRPTPFGTDHLDSERRNEGESVPAANQ